MKMLLIALGGAIGSCLRYLVMNFAQSHSASTTAKWFGHALPIGTLTVNLVGCLLIGVLSGLFARHLLPQEPYRLALTVGILGGFTTFSAFGLDTFSLVESGHAKLAFLNMIASCAGGLLAVWLGFKIVGYFLPAGQL